MSREEAETNGPCALVPGVQVRENDTMSIKQLDFDEPVLDSMMASPLRAVTPLTGPERMRLDQISVFYDGVPAVRQASLSIHQGEVLALIGPSGCGKTTLLRTLNRLTELTPNASHSGQITLDGEDIHELEDTKLRTRVSMVFQQPNPFPMSIFDNVAFALREQSRRRRAGASSSRRSSRPCSEPASTRRSGPTSAVPRCAFRRTAAAPVHRAGDRDRTGDPFDGRAVLGARPALHRGDRGPDPPAPQGARRCDRDAQPPAGAPHSRPRGFMYLGDLVELGDAAQLFEPPREERTREYIAGAFG